MKRSGVRRLLLPLVPIYGAVVAVKGWLYDCGVLKARRLPHPVISVGSLSVGGAGKTPVVLMLAEWFEREGFEVRVLTRGYGRIGTAVEPVDPEGDAARFGDEPLMMARNLEPGSVWVGSDRFTAAVLAGRADTPQTTATYLLDDGFQHRKLARNIDVVLVTRRDVEDWLLPAGNLREPSGALRRADVVVVREDEAGLEAWVRAVLAGKLCAVWTAERKLVFPEGEALPTRPVVFCALARPDGFVKMLRDADILPVAVETFRDHHAYAEKDIARLIELARRHDADGFLTTEKDAVKLSLAIMERLKAIGPVIVPRLRAEVADAERAMTELMMLIAARSAGDSDAA